MSTSDSGTVLTATEPQAPLARKPTMDPRTRPGPPSGDIQPKRNKEVGPQEITSLHLRTHQPIRGNIPGLFVEQNFLQTPNQDYPPQPEILNHARASESQEAFASEGRGVAPCPPPGAVPLAVGGGAGGQPPLDEVVRTLYNELGGERAQRWQLESQLALLSTERDCFIAERDAARAERDAVITVNMSLEAQILAVAELLKGLETNALAGLWETVTLPNTT
ncbi:hypothetical protein M407DRAFT_31505 [Tulasnella calospora MUT 4182]|uniref:Uncharacterized protein n=1 Tax=Tulasnella calospora MUT 4182 TaxID=1051891 RepID=A0A0C3Q5I2_9AGAM|nr:hypothetical protein M407DRAFT_31505 [Tulasnella calospora MUT 4182]